MPPIREHIDLEDGGDDDDDGDDMPTLVDQPMTYTFSTEMTPLSFNPSSTAADAPVTPFTFASASNEASSSQLSPPHPPRSSHGKRRDASYIPRPPNAFILFRSSFIRSQQVTGKVEGNHSNLSKIIGLLWKTLPKEERDEWEAKAAAAQLEHRKRYPDWRFRPGANASAKLKIKDGGGAGSSKQRRMRATKDPPDSDGEDSHDNPEIDEPTDKKGKGKGRATSRRKIKDQAKVKENEKELARKAKEEKRFAKIADLLVAGKRGVELEIAVKEWEGGRKGKKKSNKAVEAANTAKGPAESSSQHKCDAPAPLVISVASPGTSQSPSTSPSLSLHGPNTQSPLSLWSISTPATPDTDAADRDTVTTYLSRRRPLPHHHDSYPRRRSQSRSRSTSRSASGSPTRSRAPIQAQQQKPASPLSGGTPLTQMFKRSLSAPASDNRMPYSRNLPVPSASLPASNDKSPADNGQPTKTKRLRHRASESVSFSFNNLHMSPMEPHQQPEDRILERQTYDQGYRTLAPQYQQQYQQHHSSLTETLSSPTSSSPRISAPSVQHHLHPQSTFYQQSDHPSLHPHPPRLTWQEEEDHRRMEVASGYPYWWRPPPSEDVVERPTPTQPSELYEPVREGSFEYDTNIDEGQQGYPAVREPGAGDTMDQRYLEQFPPLPHGEDPTTATSTTGESRSIRWTQTASRLGLVASPDQGNNNNNCNVAAYTNDGRLIDSSSPLSISTFTPTAPIPTTTTNLSPVSVTGPLQEQQHLNTDPTAGQYFYPLPPTPISPLAPFSSSFSSLAGWDGESRQMQFNNLPITGALAAECSRENDPNTNNGDDGSSSNGVLQQNARGGLQSIGLQGGRGAGSGWGTEERSF